MTNENRMRVWTRVEQGEYSIEKELEIDVQHLSMEARINLIKSVFITRIETEEPGE